MLRAARQSLLKNDCRLVEQFVLTIPEDSDHENHMVGEVSKMLTKTLATTIQSTLIQECMLVLVCLGLHTF